MLGRIIIRVIVEDNIIRLFYFIPDMVTFYPVLSIPILYRIFLDPGRLIVLHKLVNGHCAHFHSASKVDLNSGSRAVRRQTC